MASLDELVSTVESIHATGLDEAAWPAALANIRRLFDGAAAMFEVVDKKAFRHRVFRSHNLPTATEIAYLAEQVTHNPRWTTLMPRQRSGDVGWDYQFIDEAGMDREPFYADFLKPLDMRYFLSGVLLANEEDYVCISVPRTRHAEDADIALMQKLLPHLQQAFEVSRRLKRAETIGNSFEQAMESFEDGVAAIRADGTLAYANATFVDILRRTDVLRLRNGRIEISDPRCNALLVHAIAAIARPGDSAPAVTADVLAPRRDDASAYVLSVRPVGPRERPSDPVALVFVRDTSRRLTTARDDLRGRFGLTEAEAMLAQALLEGVTPGSYAVTRGMSLNTVYTHLRRLREKTGSRRMTELIYKLGDPRRSSRTD